MLLAGLLLLVVAAAPTLLGYPAFASLSATPAAEVSWSEPDDALALPARHRDTPAFPQDHLAFDERDDSRSAAWAEGDLPEGTTVFDDEFPGIANLDPALLQALRRAASDASDEGVWFVVNSGWRSADYQEQLLREAVAKYGSQREAARWVSTPETSAHVSGDAADIGPHEATVWLSAHGARYGLCQVYRNEPWHYELRPEAVRSGCPAMYADPTRDPRMQP